MTKVVGIVGWKDVGKTFFVTEIINLLVKKGYKVGTIKHAHHDFDIDKIIAMTDDALEALRENEAIIRNRLKIYSVRKNALIFRNETY